MAGILFLSGLITGFQYSQIHWQNIDTYPLAESEEKQPEETFRPEKNQVDLSSDLLERQNQMKEKGAINIFSNIGETLDLFESTS